MSRTARHAAEAQEMLDAAAAAHVGRLRDGDALSVPGLRALKAGERVNVLRYWLCESGVEPPSTARLTEALRQIFDAQVDHMPADRVGPMRAAALPAKNIPHRAAAAAAGRRRGAGGWRAARVCELGPAIGELALDRRKPAASTPSICRSS